MAAGSLLHAEVEWLHSDDCLVVTAMVFAMVGRRPDLARPSRCPGAITRPRRAGCSWSPAACPYSSWPRVPQGTEEIHRLLASSMLGATTRDLWMFGVLALCSFLVLWRLRLRIVLFTMDPATALAAGVPRQFGTALMLWLGLAVGLSIRVTGTLYTFGCLVLPALAARQVCREVRQLVWVTPLIALLGTASAFVVANHTDDPPGPMAVAFLAGLCVVGAIWHRCRRP